MWGKGGFYFLNLAKKNLWLSCLSFHIFVWNAFYYANTAAKYAYTGGIKNKIVIIEP